MIARIALLAALVAAPAFALAQQPNPDATFAAWDKDKNGALSKDEFRAGWANTRDELAVRRLHQEFQRHDADKSGKLEPAEYAKLALVQRAPAAAPQMSAFDKNKDGGLQFPEYIDFVKVAGQSLQPRAASPVAPKAK